MLKLWFARLMLSVTGLTRLAVRRRQLQRIRRSCIANRPNKPLEVTLRALLMRVCAPWFCFCLHELDAVVPAAAVQLISSIRSLYDQTNSNNAYVVILGPS